MILNPDTCTTCTFSNNNFYNTTGDTNYSPFYGITYSNAGTGIVLSQNRMSSTSSSNLLQDIGGSANIYTDLSWELETETVMFNYTTSGGVKLETMGDKSSLFRRLPNTAGTKILYSNAIYSRVVDGNQNYGVTSWYGGDYYQPATFTFTGANTSAGVTLTNVTMSLIGVYWTA